LDALEKEDQLKSLCHPLSYDTKGDDMKKHRQLTYKDRLYIEILGNIAISGKQIAQVIGVHPSTISRELKRGRGYYFGQFIFGYKCNLAEGRRRHVIKNRGRKSKINGELEKYVTSKIREGWSPEQISGRLKYEGRTYVGRETIYKFVMTNRKKGGDLYLSLRRGRRRRRKRFAIARVREDILNRKSIEDRPSIVNNRERVGDWERDLMFGSSRKKALLTFTERKTLFTVLRKVESKSPKEISNKTIECMKKHICHSITNDNGFEFRSHQLESESLNASIYFAHPYSSWERGTNENTNGLIRQYFEQTQDMENFNDEQANQIAKILNSRPRKKLGFRTPEEAYTSKAIAIKVG
jgi:IS30 family transposase